MRDLFPQLRILLLCGVADAPGAQATAAAAIEPVLNNISQAQLWQPYCDQPVTVHIDTGMQRLGFTLEELEAVDWSAYNVATVMTHLACADTPAHPLNVRQLEAFAHGVRHFPGVPTSIANSAGCLLPQDWHGDLTRPGIGLYGGHPQNRIADNPLMPVVHMAGRVLALRTVTAGTPVGYGGSFVAERLTRIAVVGLGYADGLPRSLSHKGQVSWRGSRAPMLGRISMDLTHIDITDWVGSGLGSGSGAGPQIGDWVEFLNADIGIDEMAQWAGTIGLEILCGLGRRPNWEYRS